MPMDEEDRKRMTELENHIRDLVGENERLRDRARQPEDFTDVEMGEGEGEGEHETQTTVLMEQRCSCGAHRTVRVVAGEAIPPYEHLHRGEKRAATAAPTARRPPLRRGVPFTRSR